MPLTGKISDRIRKLIGEGYEYDQAVAIAFASMKKRPQRKAPAKRSPQLPKRGGRTSTNKRRRKK
jgi:hypothetical protein